MNGFVILWSYLSATPLLWLTATIAAYLIAESLAARVALAFKSSVRHIRLRAKSQVGRPPNTALMKKGIYSTKRKREMLAEATGDAELVV